MFLKRIIFDLKLFTVIVKSQNIFSHVTHAVTKNVFEKKHFEDSLEKI